VKLHMVAAGEWERPPMTQQSGRRETVLQKTGSPPWRKLGPARPRHDQAHLDEPRVHAAPGASAEQAAVELAQWRRAFDAHISQSLNDINRTLGVMRAATSAGRPLRPYGCGTRTRQPSAR
jgi:hypothetical protein